MCFGAAAYVSYMLLSCRRPALTSGMRRKCISSVLPSIFFLSVCGTDFGVEECATMAHAGTFANLNWRGFTSASGPVFLPGILRLGGDSNPFRSTGPKRIWHDWVTLSLSGINVTRVCSDISLPSGDRTGWGMSGVASWRETKNSDYANGCWRIF
jgi:hypothetical protein